MLTLLCGDRRRELCETRRMPLQRAVLLLTTATLIAAAVTLAAGTSSSSSGDKVYLLNAMYSTDQNTANIAQAVWLGMDAAFHNADYTAAGGRKIEIVSPSSSVNQSNIVAVVEAALADYPSLLGVLGPFSDATLAAVLASTTIQSAGLMFLGPFTGSGAVRTWNENVYFTRAEPRLEIMVIVKYIANTLRARRTAFMYQTDVNFGDTEYADYVSLMASLALDAPALYAVPYSTTSTALNTTAFDAMANTYPQVVVLWGMPGVQTANFLEAVLTDPRTSSAYIMPSFVLQQETFNVYYGLGMAGTITPVAGQVVSSATVFPLNLLGTAHIPIFSAQMGDYILKTGNVNASLWADEAKYVAKYGRATGPSPSSSSLSSSAAAHEFFVQHPSTAQLMITGWITGTIVMQTLSEANYFTDRATYQSFLFEQHRYIVGGDFVIGDYGAPCTYVGKFLGAVCSCNQGGHAAVLSNLSAAAWTVVTDSGVNYTQNDCYSVGTELPRLLNFLTLVFQDHTQMADIAIQYVALIPDIADNVLDAQNPINFAALNVTEATVQVLVDKQLSNFTTDVVTGTIIKGMSLGNYLVMGPNFPHPHLVLPYRNYVYLMPTLEQQLYLLYANLATVQGVTSIGSDVRMIMHDYPADELVNFTTVMQESAATFNYDNPTVTVVSAATTVESALADKTINFVFAATAADVPVIATFLATHTTAMVVICFDDLALQYDAYVSAFSTVAASVQARLITFTNLPLWSDTSAAALAASQLLTEFYNAVPANTTCAPALLRDFLATFLVQELMDTTQDVNTTTLANTIYQTGTVAVYGMTFGTFKWSCTGKGTTSVCVYKNYGARGISMLSMQRILDGATPTLTSATTPSMVYSPRRQDGLTAAQRSGVIAGCVVGGLALIAAVALLVYCCSDGRDNAAAPKNHREPVTLIFTDIESSTAMWAALPLLMADAIAAHHRVIRQLIKKHGCYEVKTIGDSFMIACKDAYSAVQLACEVQTRLLEYDWGTTEIDSTYREFELARVDSVEGYEPPTARLSKEEYAALWRGLRVRIGLHTGLSDIRYDEVTKGYDYYGDTSNMAARTEAIANGGQVVATEIAWWALSDEERDATAHTEFGPQGLRGVPYAVEMYQLNPVPGRTHAALRTEIEAILPDDNATDAASSAAGALLSSAGTMTGAAAGVAFVISSCFVPYPPAQRVRELQPLLAKWNIGAPPRPRQVSEEDYCTGLVNRLAIRIAIIAEARQHIIGDGSEGEGELSINTVHELHGRLVSGTFGGRLPAPGSNSGSSAGPPRGDVVSGMRESRVYRRGGSGLRSQFASVVSTANAAPRLPMVVRWGDAVVPFHLEDANATSVETYNVSASASTPDEGAAGRRVEASGCRRRSQKARGGGGGDAGAGGSYADAAARGDA